MTTTQQRKLSSYLIITVAVALIAFILGFFGRSIFTAIANSINNRDLTAGGDKVICDSSVLSNETPTGIVIAGPLNLRSGPGLDFDVISTIEICKLVSLTGRSRDYAWLEVKLPKNVKGWVFSPYIQTNINILDLEVNTSFADIITGRSPSSTHSGYDASVIIEGNQAVAFIKGMPANEVIKAVLSPSDSSDNSLEVCLGRTDRKGNATLIFPMPTHWPDGSALQSGIITLVLKAGSETRTVSLTFYTN